MNHRIVSNVVMLLMLLLAVATGLFAVAASARSEDAGDPAPVPDNPHPDLRQTRACLDCHTVTGGTIPVTHRAYALETCGTCHPRAPRVLVPHAITMGDARCLLCHGDPARDLGIPAGHLEYETRECLLCHPVDPARYDVAPPPAGISRSPAQDIPHPLGGFFEDCLFCHQIGGESGTLPDNHRRFEVQTCTE
ncbi:MAG TPA: hypothetical protein VFH17_02860, partial [Coriobacteriia bacterium]|nr:hypothetical protein [Coriobacteriia bacterium]